jgi:hypothetical protein
VEECSCFECSHQLRPDVQLTRKPHRVFLHTSNVVVGDLIARVDVWASCLDCREDIELIRDARRYHASVRSPF